MRSALNPVYDFKAFNTDRLEPCLPYDAVMAALPPGVAISGQRFSCSPISPTIAGIYPSVERILRTSATAINGTNTIRFQPQWITTNLNTKFNVQYMFGSRLDRGHPRVKRSVKCETCDITLNSEQQAKQHYRGKYHQRKVRPKTSQSAPVNDEHAPADVNDHAPVNDRCRTTRCNTPTDKQFAEVKRSPSPSSDEALKVKCLEVYIGDSRRDLNAERDHLVCKETVTITTATTTVTTTTDAEISNEQIDSSDDAIIGGVGVDSFDRLAAAAADDAVDCSRATDEDGCISSLLDLKREDELEIGLSVQLKTTSHKQQNTCSAYPPRVTPTAATIPGAGNTISSLNQFNSSRFSPGIFFAHQPILASSLVPVLRSQVPWHHPQASSATAPDWWFQAAPINPHLQFHSVPDLLFPGSISGARNSSGSIYTGSIVSSQTFQRYDRRTHSSDSVVMTIIPQYLDCSKFPENHGNVETHGHVLDLSNENSAINAASRCSPQFVKPITQTIGLPSNGCLVRGNRLDRESAGLLSNGDIDRLDPVSKAVYSNFLEKCLRKTKKTTKFNSGGRRRR